jgi:hypothetical protein
VTTTPKLPEVIAFLQGEVPLEGVWYGEPHPSGKPYWWRTHLREALAAAPEPPAPGVATENADCTVVGRIVYRGSRVSDVLIGATILKVPNDYLTAIPAPSAGVSVSEADPVLLKFYGVDNVPALIAAQSEHIEKLQDAARRNVKPWEDTFPPTLLPKYLRDNGLPAPTPPTVVVVQTATFCPACGEATGNPECFICAAAQVRANDSGVG